MQPAVSYITYVTSLHEQTGKIITFAHFEEGNLVKNERNAEEGESIQTSIDELSTDDDYDDRSMITNGLEYNNNGSQIHSEIIARDAILKVCERIIQTQN